ncbi:TPA: group II intron reverse transcriptase/maturase [Legionella anisa]
MSRRIISHGACGKSGTGTATREEQQVSVESTQKETLAQDLMEVVCSRSNLNRAYKRVKSNKGSPGLDGMTVEELGPYIKLHKDEIVSSLLEGRYQPQAVKGVEIPKPKGGIRQLGIPTVLDRLIQQALYQVLEPIFEPRFSNSSYGFRPKRSAHQAIKAATEYVKSGKRWVVDIDLMKYFDQVNHDILMSRLARVIGDKAVLKLIRKFLQAGMMVNGLVMERQAGTPQGGPLSPLLSNIMLNELDWELERRGHTFCRYADDCNIYVNSEKAGQRVMESVKQFLANKLKLRINEDKSAVAQVHERQFLGYRIGKTGWLIMSDDSLKRMKDKVRQLTKRNRGVSLERVIKSLNMYLPGWFQYFSHITNSDLWVKLDSWIRRRLRCYRLKQRKRKWPIATYLMKLGVSPRNAWVLAKSDKSWWRKSHNPIINTAMPNIWFDTLGLFSLHDKAKALRA